MTTTEALDLIDTRHLLEQIKMSSSKEIEEIAMEQYFTKSIFAYLDWYYDGEQSEFEKY